MKTASKAPVSERALMQRFNRNAKKDHLVVKKGKGLAKASMGNYFLIDANRKVVMETHVDLEKLCRKHGILEAWESVGEN